MKSFLIVSKKKAVSIVEAQSRSEVMEHLVTISKDLKIPYKDLKVVEMVATLDLSIYTVVNNEIRKENY